MKTRSLFGLTLAAVLLLAGCDSANVQTGAVGFEPTDFKIECVRSNGDAFGPFVATGYFEDEGEMAGGDLPAAFNPSSMDRTYEGTGYLRGQLGSAAVLVSARAISTDPPHGVGTFRFVQGTGLYDGHPAAGTYELTIDDEGNVLETFRGNVDRP